MTRFVLSVLLSRNAMHKRGLCRHAVSVCLFVRRTFVHSVETKKHIFNEFLTIGQPHHYSFIIPNVMALYRWDPPPQRSRRRMQIGWAKIAILDQYLAF